MKDKDFVIDINKDGSLILPPDIARQYGLAAGARIRIEGNANN
jgi:hypothetical protein